MPDPNWFDDFYAGLVATIGTEWPEVNQILHVIDMSRLNWLNKIQEGQLTPPWVVIWIPAMTPVSGGSAIRKTIRPTLFYIRANDADDAVTTLTSKMADMEMRIYSRGVSAHATVTSEAATIDVSDTNPVNRVMLESNMPFVCGSISFECETGFIANILGG